MATFAIGRSCRAAIDAMNPRICIMEKIDPAAELLTLINVFAVDPAKADALL